MAMKVLSDQEFQEFDRLFNSYSNDADREQKISITMLFINNRRID